jgi:hypothetical protein
MTRQETKYQKAREQIKKSLSQEQTPLIPGLKLRPGTGTALIPPVPANLPLPPQYARNPENLSAEAVALLSLIRLPWRLTLWQASVISGFSEENLRDLISLGHIPVSNEGPGTTIYISLTELQSLFSDPNTVRELTRIINRLHRTRNEEKARRRLEREAIGAKNVET